MRGFVNKSFRFSCFRLTLFVTFGADLGMTRAGVI